MLLPAATIEEQDEMLNRTTPPSPLSYELTVANLNQDFWKKFEDYLVTHQTAKTVESRLTYAEKFGHIIRSSQGNASELLTLKQEKRLHAMKALASLSEFLGINDEWKKIRERYQLKWSNGDSLESFEKMYNNEED
jgi:hypothetical protein